ncbi:MAG: acetate kinase [Oscillospiraceae bacterium]|jgi:acetate kinase|nr:acetate kinase [Oscillospiraceae bacterium]
MKILVINAGSSSLKYQLIETDTEQVLAKGNCERIGIGGHISHKTFDGRSYDKDVDFPTHSEAFETLKNVLLDKASGVISDLSEISAVGHRMVHGAEAFKSSVLIDDKVIEDFTALLDIAPLHNPANLTAVLACRSAFGKEVPEAGVFDTAFHQTMPEKAYIYAIPYEYYQEDGVRRYGFHGTSHKYVSARCAALMGKPISELKIISCHLGNGSSVTAVKGGLSVDTSMGFTPLAGVVMGTRSGDVDPAAIYYIAKKRGLSFDEAIDILNKKSGYLGVSGLTSDDRDLRAAAEKGDKCAALAGSVMRYSVLKYIGAYAAAMNGVDAIVFTGGIGEHSSDLREEICADLSYLGLYLDKEANAPSSLPETEISTPDSKVKAFVIPTNEELMIAYETLALVGGK